MRRGVWKGETVEAGSGGTVELGSEGTVDAGSESAGLAKKSAEERKALLAQAVADEVKRRWRVESEEDFHTVMVKPRRSTYLLRVIFTVLMSPQAESVGGDKRQMVWIDEYGHTNIQR